MNIINLITAVSRPWNLLAMLHSMETCPPGEGLSVRWILVFDSPDDIPAYLRAAVSSAKRTEIRVLIYGRGKSKYGIPQKNIGIDASRGGWFLVLDDDTILHPKYLSTLSSEMSKNPDKKAFIYSQRRWDSIGDLKAFPGCLRQGGVDNGMFTLNADLVGNDRYNLAIAGDEDSFLIQAIYKRDPGAFHFIEEQLSYYNYLDVARIPDWLAERGRR